MYTVWGACEDVAIIEKFRHGEYRIDNLFLLDEASTHVLDVGGVSLRLFGLGGAVVQHKLFDNGEGNSISTIFFFSSAIDAFSLFFIKKRHRYNCWWFRCNVDNCITNR